MKALHRIRRPSLLPPLLLLLAMLVQCARAADFSKCNEKTTACMVHGTCSTDPADHEFDEYVGRKKHKIKSDCKRYFIIQAISIDKVQIEFQDEKYDKANGAAFYHGGGAWLIKCIANKATVTPALGTADNIPDSSVPDGAYCKFTLTATNNPKNIAKVVKNSENWPEHISSLKQNADSPNADFRGSNFGDIKFPWCDWTGNLFRSNVAEPDEDSASLAVSEGDGRLCNPTYFNWYKASGQSEWVLIKDFKCNSGTISTVKKNDESQELDFEHGRTKCTRKKCAKCTCYFCDADPDAPDPSRPKFTDTDGTTCTQISCPDKTLNKMLVHTDAGWRVHHTKTESAAELANAIVCESDKAADGTHEDGKWKDYIKDSIKNATCVAEVLCTDKRLNPTGLKTSCEGVEVRGKNCSLATIKDDGSELCARREQSRYKLNGEVVERAADSFKCDKNNGNWIANGSIAVDDGSTVYCLEDVVVEDHNKSAPMRGDGGKLIGIICGVALVVVVIIIVVVLCSRRYLKKKGKSSMKSVSVTGKNKKSKKAKKGSKSSSKTSEQISAPPPPPCPDSLNFRVEPDPPLPQSSQQPSSGGGVPPAAVGPDTGKPDKPAELIDIKLESEKKDTEKESKKESKPLKDQESVVNTVTGTTFDKTKSGAEPAKDGATVSTKKGANESGRSDTGTGRNSKKKLKVNKDGKVELDKHGRGMTDDDDYNIDEGAKPVDAVEKNKKPYVPAIDPRKKHINVTVTEDEDGKILPKNMPAPF